MGKKDELFNKGIFTLSLDMELAWGVVDKPKIFDKNINYYRNTRSVIKEILKLLVTYNISATWAVVGCLFLENKMILKDNNTITDLWHGRDIINQIINCSIYQEIGCHSFSHIIFDDNSISKERVHTDLLRCIEEANKMNVEMTSFIFPRNRVGFLDVLPEYGFKSYRGIEPSWYRKMPNNLKRICHLIDQFAGFSPPVNKPILKEEGIINIPASMLYMPMNGVRKYIPLKSRVNKAIKGIEKAVDRNKVFHLWFHPYNISTNPEILLCGLEKIFIKVDEERKKRNIEVKTMDQIVNTFRMKDV